MVGGQFSSIDTGELSGRYDSSGLQVVDVRPIFAYNGWQYGAEERTGHIEGARSLPFKWTRYIEWMEIIEKKNITPAQTVVIYGRDEDKIRKTARQFSKAGFEDLQLYFEFENEWSKDPELPVNRLSRYEQLVHPGWVEELIDGGTPPHCNGEDFVICHAYYRDKTAYDEGHIPGAIPLDTNQLEDPETWNRRLPEEIETTLLGKGISADTTVVLYGRFSNPSYEQEFPGSSAGQLAALRCAFLMLYAGVKDVKILNGGLQSWLDAGLQETDKEYEPGASSEFGADIPGRPELVVDTEQAQKILSSPEKNLVSVRSREEFLGKRSGYHYIDKKGRIPGAVFGNCGSDAYHMENYRNLDHTTREFQEIESFWREAGITPDKHNSFYCGTGWRASEAFFNAWLMGWSDISVYDGGWYEWSRDDTNPIEKGKP